MTNTPSVEAVPRASQRLFQGIALLLFLGSGAITVTWSRAMNAMGGMAMPGGWTMSMAWMRMPGQAWLDVAAGFLGMWSVMMLAMMLPSLLPALRRYRQGSTAASELRRHGLIALVGAGYFTVWVAVGAAAFVPGAVLAELAMRHAALAQAVPLLSAAAVMLAGALQFTPWKLRHLGCCRRLPRKGEALAAAPGAAWRQGLRLGWHCCHCCAGFTLMLLVLGVMDLRAMALAMAAITLERLAPDGARAARCIGGVVLGMGLLSMAWSLAA